MKRGGIYDETRQEGRSSRNKERNLAWIIEHAWFILKLY